MEDADLDVAEPQPPFRFIDPTDLHTKLFGLTLYMLRLGGNAVHAA